MAKKRVAVKTSVARNSSKPLSGKIALIGDVLPNSGATEIDAAGKAVAPGFIDVHTHVDGDIHKYPAAENFVRDGVTTIVSGNCGGSV